MRSVLNGNSKRLGRYTLTQKWTDVLLLCFFRLMPLMLIIIIGWSSEKPFWARTLGSIPSTLNVFLAIEGDTIGVEAFESVVEEVEGGNKYLRFFCRKTG